MKCVSLYGINAAGERVPVSFADPGLRVEPVDSALLDVGTADECLGGQIPLVVLGVGTTAVR